MSIVFRCGCGKKLQVKDEAASLLNLGISRIKELLKIAVWDEKRKEPIRNMEVAGRGI